LRSRGIAAATGGLLVAGALVLSGCAAGGGNGGASAPTGDPKAIITANFVEPGGPLITTAINETSGAKVLNMIYAGLVYYDEKGKPLNDIADSITTDDSQTWTIKIKKGEKFTNGEAVTADSFINAWDYGALASNAQLNSYFFEDIKGFSYDDDVHIKDTGLTKVDDLTFKVELKQKLADFGIRLGYSAYFPLPSVAFSDLKAFGENPIGNGPYKFASEGAWKHNEKIDLVINKDYTGPRKAKNGGISFVVYQTDSAAYADLLSGNLDVDDTIPNEDLGNFKDDLGDNYFDQASAVFQSFTIPEKMKHFGSDDEGRLRRQAISMAIDRDSITKVIFQGTRTPAHDFTSPVIDGYSEDIKGSDVLKYNPDKAKELWAQADAISPWDGKFEIAYNADSSHKDWVDATANSIKNVLGIDASGVGVPTFTAFRKQINDRTITTAFRTGWQADYPGLLDFLGPLYATAAGSNDGDYSNPDFDALVKKGSAADSAAEANKLYQQAQEILFQDLPAIPLWYSKVQGGFSSDVSNVHVGWDSVPLYYEVTKSASK